MHKLWPSVENTELNSILVSITKLNKMIIIVFVGPNFVIYDLPVDIQDKKHIDIFE